MQRERFAIGCDEKSDGAAGSPFLGTDQPSRDDVARWVLKNRVRIRRRVLAKARSAGVAWLDLDDVTSSVIRRVDAAVPRGLIRASSEREFWAFVVAVTDNLVLDRLRSVRRSDCLFVWGEDEGDCAVCASGWFDRCRTTDDAAVILHDLLMSLDSDGDRDLVLWKIRGVPYASVAAATGRTEAALRTQWKKICRLFRERLPRDAKAAAVELVGEELL